MRARCLSRALPSRMALRLAQMRVSVRYTAVMTLVVQVPESSGSSSRHSSAASVMRFRAIQGIDHVIGNAVGLFHVRNHIALERGYVAFYRRQQIEVEASNIVVTRLSLASKTDSSCARHCGRSSQSGLPGGLIFASAKRGGDVSRGADGMGVPGFYSYAAMVTTAHGISYCISSRCAVRNSEQEVVVRS